MPRNARSNRSEDKRPNFPARYHALIHGKRNSIIIRIEFLHNVVLHSNDASITGCKRGRLQYCLLLGLQPHRAVRGWYGASAQILLAILTVEGGRALRGVDRKGSSRIRARHRPSVPARNPRALRRNAPRTRRLTTPITASICRMPRCTRSSCRTRPPTTAPAPRTPWPGSRALDAEDAAEGLFAEGLRRCTNVWARQPRQDEESRLTPLSAASGRRSLGCQRQSLQSHPTSRHQAPETRWYQWRRVLWQRLSPPSFLQQAGGVAMAAGHSAE
jgi:hypothetical protein